MLLQPIATLPSTDPQISVEVRATGPAAFKVLQALGKIDPCAVACKPVTQAVRLELWNGPVVDRA